jgi:hypothetical protein
MRQGLELDALARTIEGNLEALPLDGEVRVAAGEHVGTLSATTATAGTKKLTPKRAAIR